MLGQISGCDEVPVDPASLHKRKHSVRDETQPAIVGRRLRSALIIQSAKFPCQLGFV